MCVCVCVCLCVCLCVCVCVCACVRGVGGSGEWLLSVSSTSASKREVERLSGNEKSAVKVDIDMTLLCSSRKSRLCDKARD